MYAFLLDPETGDLEEGISNDTVFYLQFFTEMPDPGVTDGVLADIPSIEIPLNSWITLPNGNRANIHPIIFECPIDVTLVGEGLYIPDFFGLQLYALGGLQLAQGVERSLPLRAGIHYIGHQALQLQVSLQNNYAIFDVYTHNYQRVLNQLYPSGAAWSQDPDSTHQTRLLAQSIEYSRIDYRLSLFDLELQPATAEEFLPEWEADLGLPEFGETGLTVAERQERAHFKHTVQPVPTETFIIELAESLGYTGVEIVHNGDPFLCTSECNDYLQGGYWLYTWTLVTDQSTANDDRLMSLVLKYAFSHNFVLFELGP